MSKKQITIIRFEQHGQDFSTWEVDSTGMVISSEPFQGWMWGGGVVHNLKTLKRGGEVAWSKKGVSPLMEIKYPVVSITHRASRFAIERPGKTKRWLSTGLGMTSNFNDAKVFKTEAAAKAMRSRECSQCKPSDIIIEL